MRYLIKKGIILFSFLMLLSYSVLFYEGEVQVVVFYILLVLALVLLFLVFFLHYRNRKYELELSNLKVELEAKKQLEKNMYFNHQVIENQIEIREETLKNISWELQDNIGQLMTLAKIQVQNAKDDPSKIEQVETIIGNGLTELRMLSKIINPNIIKNLDLEEAIQLELERYNRLNFIQSNYKSIGEKQYLTKEDSVVLFRIIQEFFKNTIQHSQATKLEVLLHYTKNQIKIKLSDNGKGFDKLNTDKKIGLKTMQDRADLIGAILHLDSIVNKGTYLEVKHHLIPKS